MAQRIPVVRTSMFSGKRHVAYLPLTEEQLHSRQWQHLPPEWREFCMTGVTPQEWRKEFGKIRSATFDGEEIEPVRIEEAR